MSTRAVADGADLERMVWAASRRPLPHPGLGNTDARLAALADLGARDLCLAKLVEPHHDARAILADLAMEPPEGDTLWAVWAAEPPSGGLTAERDASGWRLSGRKEFCSGAAMVTHALVTARADDGPRLFAVDLGAAGSAGEVALSDPEWVGAGMRRAGTRTLLVDRLPGRPAGGPGDYLRRPGFWHGGVGVAACWLGGARAVTDTLLRAGLAREMGPHVAAHLGAVTASMDAATAHLYAAAAQIDRDPHDDGGDARRTAQSVRATVAATAEDVMARTARALGPGPLAFDGVHAQRVADLQVFVRQHHAERDLADLGRWVVEGAHGEAAR